MIIILLVLIIILFLLYYQYSYKKKDYDNIYKIKLDNIERIKRTPEYQNLIDKLINDKKQLFTKEEIEAMKNKFQFYNKEYGIDNISDEILSSFKDNNNNNNKNIENTPEENIHIEETINENPAYNAILNTIGNKYIPSCKDVEVLKNKSYLKNYYYDMGANRIQSNLKDYVNDYQIQIDDNNRICQKVDSVKTKSGFIIPDQYPTLKYQTNAYNIDWGRIQNPWTIY